MADTIRSGRDQSLRPDQAPDQDHRPTEPPAVSLAEPLAVSLAQADLLSALDRLPIGVALLTPDRRVVLLNRSLEAMTGFTRREAKGVPCRHVLRSGACLRQCPALAWEPCPEGAGDPRHPGLPQGVQGMPGMETTIITRDRRKMPVRLTPVPITDHAGQLLYWAEVVEDVSPIKDLEARVKAATGSGRLLGRSAEMERILRVIPVLAQMDSPVLITGETGTGKDMVAEAIHNESPRSREPFVRVNVSPLPEPILESELFGHVKGAYPWAGEDKPGRMREAGSGTVYLTEIGDLSPNLQAKLLRFLDEGIVHPVGSDRGVKVSARLVIATHKDPEALVAQGALRQDLFHRLNGVRLHLPPLRERTGDVLFLLNHFLESFSARLKKSVTGFSPRALKILLGYDFPGNVREIRNIVEYAVMVCHKDTILPAHLPVHLLMAPADERKTTRAAGRAGGRS